MMVIVGIIVVSTISRYFFNEPFQWSDEGARYAMIYGTVFGTVMAYLRSSHVKFSVITDFLGSRGHKIFEAMVHLSALLFGVTLSASGFLFMRSRGNVLSTGLGIPMYWAQAAMWIGGVGLTIAALLQLLIFFRRIVNGDDSAQTSYLNSSPE